MCNQIDIHGSEVPGSAPPSATYKLLEALDTQLMPFSPSSRATDSHLVIHTQVWCGILKALIVYQRPFDSFTQVPPAIATTSDICSPPSNHTHRWEPYYGSGGKLGLCSASVVMRVSQLARPLPGKQCEYAT